MHLVQINDSASSWWLDDEVIILIECVEAENELKHLEQGVPRVKIALGGSAACRAMLAANDFPLL